MQRHGLTHLKIFFKVDFVQFAEIKVHTPTEVLNGQLSS